MQTIIKIFAGVVILLVSSHVFAAKPISNKAPTVSLTSPTSGTTFVAPASISMSATATDSDGAIAKVEFYRGSTLVSTSTTSPYTGLATNVPAGIYTLTAKAYDNLGAVTTSAGVTVTVNAAANIVFTSPVNGAVIYSPQIGINGTYVGDPLTTTVLADNGDISRIARLTGNTFAVTADLEYGSNVIDVLVSRVDKTFDKATINLIRYDYPLVAFKTPITNVFDVPGNIQLEVDAVSPGGQIRQVDFYNGPTLLATSGSPPYRYTFQSGLAGRYYLSAVATDNNGVTGTGYLSVLLNGPNVLPAITLTSPINGSTLTAPATINLAANATDSDGTVTLVEFLQNGVVVGASNSSPYKFTLTNVVAGVYQFTARATDDRGGVTTSSSATATVTPPNNPPVVSLTSPLSGSSYYAPAVINLSADAADSDGTVSMVEFYQGAVLVGTATSSPYSISLANVGVGSYSITAKATDNLGATTISAPVVVVVNPNIPPTVTLTSPSSATNAFAPASFTLKADAADSDGIAMVEFYQDATLIGTATSAPYAINWANIPAGVYSVTAKATDNLGGATVSPPVVVTVNAPKLTFTTPVDGATLTGDSVLITGSFQGNSNSGVTVNGVVAVTDANNNFYATIPLAAGPNIVTATLTSFEGTTTTQSINVTSDGVAPAIQINADQVEGIAPLTVRFSVDGAGITGGNILASGGTVTSTFENGKLIFTVVYPNPGTFPATITATDRIGNSVSKSFVIVVQDAARMEQMFKSMWDGMNNALIAGDKATAMKYMNEQAKNKYGPVFDALLPEFPNIIASFSGIQSSAISIGISELAINRTIDGVNRIFFIYFLQDTDGVWRLDSM